MTYTPHPRRTQVTGDMFHPALPAGSHWAGRRRPGLPASPFANPHPVDHGRKTPCPLCGIRHTLAEALNLYQQHLDARPDLVVLAAVLDPTVRFACRCPLDQRCHVDELLARADQVTVIAQGDNRDTKTAVHTIPVRVGECCGDQGACGQPAAVAVRCTIDQQHPAEVSTYRVTFCADHQGEAPRMHARWVESARELLDPVKHAQFLAAAGVSR